MAFAEQRSVFSFGMVVAERLDLIRRRILDGHVVSVSAAAQESGKFRLKVVMLASPSVIPVVLRREALVYFNAVAALTSVWPTVDRGHLFSSGIAKASFWSSPPSTATIVGARTGGNNDDDDNDDGHHDEDPKDDQHQPDPPTEDPWVHGADPWGNNKQSHACPRPAKQPRHRAVGIVAEPESWTTLPEVPEFPFSFRTVPIDMKSGCASVLHPSEPQDSLPSVLSSAPGNHYFIGDQEGDVVPSGSSTAATIEDLEVRLHRIEMLLFQLPIPNFEKIDASISAMLSQPEHAVEEKIATKVAAATCIQAWYRGFTTRRRTAVLRVIQHHMLAFQGHFASCCAQIEETVNQFVHEGAYLNG